MIQEYPAYYNRFHCIADKCPDTCCAGWEVDLDDEAWYRYLVVRGPFGDRLRANMRDDGEWKYFPLNRQGRCPFLDEHNLCEIYQQLGEKALCQTCAEHPRYYVDCGDYEQMDLSLGCPEAARIFFTEEGKIQYIRQNLPDADDTPDVSPAVFSNITEADERSDSFTEADRERRDQLLGERDHILDLLQMESSNTLDKRMKEAGIWLPVSDEEILQIADAMEPLNQNWTRRVALMHTLAIRRSVSNAEAVPDQWMTRLACYLVYRYWIDAFFADQDKPAEELSLNIRKEGRHYEEDVPAGIYTDSRMPQIRLINRSLRLIQLLYLSDLPEDLKGTAPDSSADDTSRDNIRMEHMMDVAHIFSRQVEFDDANVELMKTPSGGVR